MARASVIEQLLEDGVVGEKEADVAAHHLFGAEAEHGFGAWVPAGYNAPVGHRKNAVGRRLHNGGELGLGRLGRLALRYVPDGGYDKFPATAAAYGSKADVDGELATVLAPGVKVEPGPHGTSAGVGRVVGPASVMRVAEALRDQELYVFPLDFLG